MSFVLCGRLSKIHSIIMINTGYIISSNSYQPNPSISKSYITTKNSAIGIQTGLMTVETMAG